MRFGAILMTWPLAEGIVSVLAKATNSFLSSTYGLARMPHGHFLASKWPCGLFAQLRGCGCKTVLTSRLLLGHHQSHGEMGEQVGSCHDDTAWLARSGNHLAGKDVSPARFGVGVGQLQHGVLP